MLTITFSVPIRAELRNQALANKQAVRVFGNLAFGDMASEIWVYDTASTATDNGTTVIKPLDDVMPVPGGAGRYLLFETMSLNDYINSGIVAGSGNVVFYLTSNKLSTGTALFTNVTYVNPIVNNSNANYAYQWSYNATTKALTVNIKTNLSTNALLNLLGGLVPVLSPPSNVADGTNVFVFVKGN